MSVRKRTWKTAAGEERQAWIVDYADQAAKRRMKTFRLKKEADAFETRSRFEITQGTHTPDSASITIAEAADLWIETCEGRRLERVASLDAGAFEEFVQAGIEGRQRGEKSAERKFLRRHRPA